MTPMSFPRCSELRLGKDQGQITLKKLQIRTGGEKKQGNEPRKTKINGNIVKG